MKNSLDDQQQLHLGNIVNTYLSFATFCYGQMYLTNYYFAVKPAVEFFNTIVEFCNTACTSVQKGRTPYAPHEGGTSQMDPKDH